MSTCFFYNEKHYKQVHGKAMGSNFKYVTPGLKSFLRKKEIDHRTEIFSISVRWLIYIINSVDKPNFRVSLPHRRSTTVSLETNPLYS